MKSIGIDIGTYSVKVAEINASQKGFNVSKVFEKELPQTPGTDSHLEVIEFLRNLFSEYDPAQTTFIMPLRQEQVSHRLKNFPFSERQKILKSLPFELEEEIPFPAENAIFDAKITKLIGSQSEVLALIAQKSRVSSAIQLAQDSGIELQILTSECGGFSNLFEKWNEPITQEPGGSIQFDDTLKPERRVALAMNIGHTHSIISVLENNRTIATRSLLWGCKNVIDAVAKKYELPFIEALNEVKTKAFILTSKQGASFDQVTFSDTIAKSAREMTRDLQLTILELKSELNALVTKIELSGGGSLILNLNAFMTQQLEIPVNRVALLDQFPNLGFERTTKADACYSLSVGLALEGLRKPRNPATNFLKQEFANRKDGFKQYWERWGVSTQIAAATLVLFFVYSSLRESFSVELVDVADLVIVDQAKKVAKLPKKQANENGVKKYIKENKKRAQELKTLAQLTHVNSSMEILKRVSDQAPPAGRTTLDVVHFKVTDQNVRVEGYTASPLEVTQLAKALESVSIDGKVNIRTASIRSRPNKTTFAFEFRVDRGLQKEGGSTR